MKQRDLIAYAESNGFKFIRHGADHDIYGKGSIMIQIPRHSEINEWTARSIIKKINRYK